MPIILQQYCEVCHAWFKGDDVEPHIEENKTHVMIEKTRYITEEEIQQLDRHQIDLPSVQPDREQIMGDIFSTAEPITQAPRLVAAIDKFPSFLAALDNYNYPLATLKAGQAYQSGDITLDDYTLITSFVPVVSS